MQHLAKIELIDRGIREAVCVKCTQRPAGSEKLSPSVARECEPDCTIFKNLPELIRATVKTDGTTGSYEGKIRNFVCAVCDASPTSGDYCTDGMARTCPLSLYGGEVVAMIEQLMGRKARGV